MSFLLWFTVVATIIAYLRKNDQQNPKSMVGYLLHFSSLSASTSWQREDHSLKRLLIHFNRGTAAGIVFGAVLVVFYTTLSVLRDDQYECVQWSVTVVPLSSSLFPWTSSANQEDSAPQWIFILIAAAFFAYTVIFYGPRSQFALDAHWQCAVRITKGLQIVSHLCAHHLPEYKVSCALASPASLYWVLCMRRRFLHCIGCQ